MIKFDAGPLTIAILLALVVGGRVLAQPIVATADITSVGSGQHETEFGDLAADALKSAAEADVALVPSSSFRETTIPAAGMDSTKLSSVLVVTDSPSDAFVVMKLSGAELLSALERSVSRLPESFGGFLQESGLKVVYDPNKDEGSRIVSAALSNGTGISATTTYSVAMTKPLADGDMGYFQIWGDGRTVKKESSSFSAVIKNFSVDHQPLDRHTDGRLTSL